MSDERSTVKTLSPSDYVVSVSAGIIGAAAAAYSTIRDRFAKDLRESDAISKAMKESHKDYVNDLEQLTRKFINGGKHKGQKVDAATWSELTGIRKARRANEILEFLEAKGFPIKGFTGHTRGMFLRYDMMSPNSKRSIAINAVVTAAIGFAGTLGFINSLHATRAIGQSANTGHER